MASGRESDVGTAEPGLTRTRGGATGGAPLQLINQPAVLKVRDSDKEATYNCMLEAADHAELDFWRHKSTKEDNAIVKKVPARRGVPAGCKGFA